MIIWSNKVEISEVEKKKIEEFISQFNSDDLEVLMNLPKPVAEGSFSSIYFIDKFALKRTPIWDYDDMYNEELEIDLILQSDHEVLMNLNDLNQTIDFYGYSEDGCWVILPKLTIPSLEDMLMSKKELTLSLETKVIEFIVQCIESGWYPVDLRFRDIFVDSNNNIKIIDYNLYQEINYLKEMEANIDFKKSPFELAINYWNKLKEVELKIIEDYLSILNLDNM